MKQVVVCDIGGGMRQIAGDAGQPETDEPVDLGADRLVEAAGFIRVARAEVAGRGVGAVA
jgi:hypothetical protein